MVVVGGTVDGLKKNNTDAATRTKSARGRGGKTGANPREQRSNALETNGEIKTLPLLCCGKQFGVFFFFFLPSSHRVLLQMFARPQFRQKLLSQTRPFTIA